MTPTLNQYYNNMSHDALLMMLEDLHEAYKESDDQWKGFCEECKAGFDSYNEWERDAVETNTNRRRQYFFMKKEVDYKNWEEFSNFLIEKGFYNK